MTACTTPATVCHTENIRNIYSLYTLLLNDGQLIGTVKENSSTILHVSRQLEQAIRGYLVYQHNEMMGFLMNINVVSQQDYNAKMRQVHLMHNRAASTFH